MAKILGTFTALLLIVASFIAFKNNGRLQKEIKDRMDTELQLTKNQARFKQAIEQTNSTKVEIEMMEKQIDVKNGEETKLKDSNKKIQSEIESKTAALNENKENLEELEKKIEKAGSISALTKSIESLRSQLEENSQSIEAKNVQLANLQAEEARISADTENRKKKIELYSSGASFSSLKSSIRSVYPTWGFVIINAGNQAGVIANSTLDVIRDGEKIAKLLVKSVENSSASASLIPDSIKQGISLEVGDLVVAAAKPTKNDQSN